MNRILMASLLATLTCNVFAGGPAPIFPGYQTHAMVTDNVLENASGVVGLNMAAGDNNLQLNARALAVTVGQGIATANVNALQQASNNRSTSPDVAISRIDGNAFNNASGIIGVNQASGVENMQMNGVAIALGLGGTGVAESVLQATATGPVENSNNVLLDPQQREATISGNAFDGARGIVQINQLAGSRNATSNNFSLGVSLGGQQ